jgi:Tfp pilus assembly protein PilF
MKKIAIPAVAMLVLVLGWLIWPRSNQTVTPSAPNESSLQLQQPPPPPPVFPPSQEADAKLRFQQGMGFVTSGRINEAIQEFSEAIRLNPNYTVAYGNRAVAYIQQKKYNKAREDLTKTLSLAPSDRIALYNLAVVYTLQQDIDLALDALDKALKNGFDNYDALRNDSDLTELRKSPEFRKVLERHKIFL